MKQIILSIIGILFLSLVANAQIYRVAEMNVEQIKKLDKEKAVVILPGGIVEEHSSYLPAFTDGYWNEQLTRELAKAIAAKKGWAAVIFPTIPLGNSGANDIGGKFSFPGTYAVLGFWEQNRLRWCLTNIE